MAKDNSNIATLSSTIRKGVDNRLKEVHTSLPAKIVTFDSITQLATVQPLIKRGFITRESETENVKYEDLPPLINIPVAFPRGGGASLTFPIVDGDECLLIFNERANDTWYQSGESSVPNARRMHSYSDAVAMVGLSSKPNVIPNFDNTNVQLKIDDSTAVITLKKDSTLDIKADTKVTVTAPDAEFSGNVRINGNLEVVGSTTLSSTVTSNGKDISDTHTHSAGTYSNGAGAVVNSSGVPE